MLATLRAIYLMSISNPTLSLVALIFIVIILRQLVVRRAKATEYLVFAALVGGLLFYVGGSLARTLEEMDPSPETVVDNFYNRPGTFLPNSYAELFATRYLRDIDDTTLFDLFKTTPRFRAVVAKEIVLRSEQTKQAFRAWAGLNFAKNPALLKDIPAELVDAKLANEVNIAIDAYFRLSPNFIKIPSSISAEQREILTHYFELLGGVPSLEPVPIVLDILLADSNEFLFVAASALAKNQTPAACRMLGMGVLTSKVPMSAWVSAMALFDEQSGENGDRCILQIINNAEDVGRLLDLFISMQRLSAQSRHAVARLSHVWSAASSSVESIRQRIEANEEELRQFQPRSPLLVALCANIKDCPQMLARELLGSIYIRTEQRRHFDSLSVRLGVWPEQAVGMLVHAVSLINPDQLTEVFDRQRGTRLRRFPAVANFSEDQTREFRRGLLVGADLIRPEGASPKLEGLTDSEVGYLVLALEAAGRMCRSEQLNPFPMGNLCRRASFARLFKVVLEIQSEMRGSGLVESMFFLTQHAARDITRELGQITEKITTDESGSAVKNLQLLTELAQHYPDFNWAAVFERLVFSEYNSRSVQVLLPVLKYVGSKQEAFRELVAKVNASKDPVIAEALEFLGGSTLHKLQNGPQVEQPQKN